MRLGLGHSLARRGFVATAVAAGPEAAYIAAITSAGATVSAPQQAAVSTFMAGEIAAGRWDGHKRIYFPVWGVAAANAICMKSLTTGTFVGSINHGAGFAQVNNLASGMRTNGSLPNIGVTKESWHFTTLVYESSGGGGREGIFFGRDYDQDFSMFDDWSYDEPNDIEYHVGGQLRVSNRTHLYRAVDGGLRLVTAFGTASTVSIKNRASGSPTSIYQFSVGGGTNTVDFVNSPFAIMAILVNNTTIQTSDMSKFGAFSFGNTMSDASDTAYTLALRTLWQTVTGLTLS